MSKAFNIATNLGAYQSAFDSSGDLTAPNVTTDSVTTNSVTTDSISAANNVNVKINNTLIPENTNIDLGSNLLSFRNIYTQDFILSNDNSGQPNSVDGTRGSWIIQEGENDLFIINNKTGKKYKFMLQEV